MPPKTVPKVFLDANTVIQVGKPPGGPILGRVKDLVKAGFITVLTTDLTCAEVAKKHAENDYEVIKEVGRPHFRRIAEEVVGIKLPDTTKAELKAKLAEAYGQSTAEMFKQLGCKTLAIDSVKPSIVFSAYSAGEGFFTGEGKKDQFPDAFIFECLKAEASQNEPVIVVSSDGDFDKPVQAQPHISLLKSLPELFKKLGLQVEAPEVDNFLKNHKEELIEAVDRELSEWGLIGDVEDSEIEETQVTEVEVKELTSFGSAKERGSILVVALLSVEVHLSYTHPNWDEAMYDSEDKRLIPFEDISGEADVSFDLDVSMAIAVDEDGDPQEIEELRFRNGDFQYVELHPYDSYK